MLNVLAFYGMYYNTCRRTQNILQTAQLEADSHYYMTIIISSYFPDT